MLAPRSKSYEPNMEYKITETELALQDLDNILSYIALTLANPTAAVSFADEVEKCYSNLKKMPMMYGFCKDLRLRALKYRKAVIKKYVMIYKVDEEEKSVSILRFFHGRQDYEKLI